MLTTHKSIILAVTLLFTLSAPMSAAPGDLDPTFGNGGIVITSDTNLYPNLINIAWAMALQADGKIVVVGDGTLGTHNWDFAVVRYNPDGSLDSSFGGTGIVHTRLTSDYDGASAVAIQADGKIVVAGSRFSTTGGSSFAVVRYNTDGSLDTSFNGTGIVITSVNSSHDYAFSVAIQTDSKIVVAGTSGFSTSNFAIVRYNADGTLDISFNGTGKVIPPVIGGISSISIQSDGKIVAAGVSLDGSVSAFTLIRYNPDGSLDTSFNGTGKVFTSLGNSYSGAQELAIQTDGKIVAAGYSGGTLGNLTVNDFALVRYNPDGSLDTSFNGTGKVITSVNNSDCTALSLGIQSNGKIVAAGYSRNDIGSDFAVVRYNSNGSLDTSFNGTGKVITAFGGQDYAIATAIQADGKIVVAGGTDNLFWDFYDFVVVRYQGDPATCSNPIDCPEVFVRQHYLDFLNREPDQGGWDYWTTQLTSCGSDVRCMHERRIGVSAAFFVELEFQRTGYVVYRLHRAAFGTWPGAPTRANLTYTQFTADRALLPEGSNIAQTTINFANGFVSRPEFLNFFPANQTNAQFVNKLFDTAELTPYTAERQQQIAAMTGGKTRAQVLLDLIEIPEFKTREYNRSFVLMEYFGYLRRDPDQGGYDFWLNVLDNRDPNNFRGMVCSFITSEEFQLRFGNAVTRRNSDCQ